MKRFLDWLLGDKCRNGTRGCWGRCIHCVRDLIAKDADDMNWRHELRRKDDE